MTNWMHSAVRPGNRVPSIARGARPAAFLSAAALLLGLAVAPAAADQIVYFVNGKAMMVRSVEKGEKFTVLEIEGGGRIGVPTEQIQRIEDYQVPQSAPHPVMQQAAQPAPAAPALATAVQAGRVQPGVPTGGPQPAQPGLGPGLGGRSTVADGRGLGGLQPLSVGGPAGAGLGAPARPAAGPNPGAGPQRPGGGGAFARGGRPGFGRPGMGRPRPPLAVQGAAPTPGAPQPTRFQYADPTDVPTAAETSPPPEDQPVQPENEPNPPDEEQPQEPQPDDPTDPDGDDPQDAPPQR